MLRRPACLPRTLRGVGGIKLIDMPGVKYPESVLQGRRGTQAQSGQPHSEAPRWGISTHDAAQMLGVSVRSARTMLNRQKAKYRLVARSGRCACMYWDRRVVERMLARRMPLVRKVPDKLCSAKEACCILLVGRSSLSRYVTSRLLTEHKVRLVTERGVRLYSYFLRAEVRKLAARRNAARVKAEAARRERLMQVWNEQQPQADNS